MERMNKAYKILKKQVADPSKKEANLEAISSLKKNAADSAGGVPEKIESIPQADRAKFIEQYKAAISELVGQIEKLEKALREDRFQDAQKELDEIGKLKREGHSAFIEEK